MLRMGVGRGGKGRQGSPRNLKFDIFLLNFEQNKVGFEWVKLNFASFYSWKNIFGYAWKNPLLALL